MGMSRGGLAPYVAMVGMEVAKGGLVIAAKEAVLSGMRSFGFVFFSNALATLLLLPSSFLIHRSRPPLTRRLLCEFFLLGVIGCSVQAVGYAGFQYTPASFASAIMSLTPGFTFILAIILGMEKADCGSSSTVAKSIGTAVSIAGAFIATLYQGPLLFNLAIASNSSSNSSPHHLLAPQTNMLLGGSLLALDCAISAVFVIAMALLMKKYPAVLIILFFYCLSVTILSAGLSLIFEGSHGSWSLQPTSRLLSILYAGVLGGSFQVGVCIWCAHQKGPFFVAMFHPLGIITSAVIGIILLGDSFYLGTLLGSVVIIIGFYCIIWGKAKEGKPIDEQQQGVSGLQEPIPEEKAPLLLGNHV
ncbi:WAT1-related protein At3g28050-like [Diospyros lotus]|uniref:WAT1-related protein At3g28050-like n=1 Tax=Diospyros lotus TaxID=55363 RepID=UPI00225491FB|nr:WAT1-related protein At3g28050-like [Diospyros lotus]